jgi:hypothetical protein
MTVSRNAERNARPRAPLRVVANRHRAQLLGTAFASLCRLSPLAAIVTVISRIQGGR